MDSLEYLISKGLIGSDHAPITPKEPINIVKNGVLFQKQCRNGLPYDIAISWLQKAIRRGLFKEALYCAFHIAALGKIFRSHLLNRLIVMVSEDIGPAEPGLAQIIEPLFFEAKELEREGSLRKMHTVIIEMIYLLANARKSRIADWLIHTTDTDGEIFDEYDDIKSAVRWAVMVSNQKLQQEERVKIKYTYGGLVYTFHKYLYVYDMWAMLLDICPKPHYREMVSLLKLFMHRGAEYGLLHLVHAITLCFYDTTKGTLKLPAGLPKWSDIGKYKFSIMNEAVDRHTFYGRKYLGRSHIDFMKYGSKLENWTPFPEEQDLIDSINAKLEEPEVEDSTPRQYQNTIVDTTVARLITDNAGWLLMACGTGKTKTSYWCMKKLTDIMKGKQLIVVVTPYLQILRQFYGCWAAMHRMHKQTVMSGILASCSDTFVKDQYTNYEYINIDKLAQFMAYPEDIKIIYTTYSSLSKLVDSGIKPDFTIYDEAHHLQHHKMFHAGKELFLTATPHKFMHSFGDVLASYSLRDAINDNFLTKYTINILEEEDTTACLEYIAENNNKTIVYCSDNATAKMLYADWIEDNPELEPQSFYVDCKTAMRKRTKIFSSYRKSPKAIIFNCAILGEGVDFPDCDSVYIHSGYVSPNRVVQASCRPLRLFPGKTMANIYITADKNVKKRLNGLEMFDHRAKEFVSYIR
jgi:superfamily II DNA or RNA helicase